MSTETDEKILRLQALVMIQSADISSLVAMYGAMQNGLAKVLPQLPTISVEYVALRKKFLQIQLETIENTKPDLAAKLQEMIDGSCKQVPFDY